MCFSGSNRCLKFILILIKRNDIIIIYLVSKLGNKCLEAFAKTIATSEMNITIFDLDLYMKIILQCIREVVALYYPNHL